MKKSAPTFLIPKDDKNLTWFDAVLFIMVLSFFCLFLSQFSLIIVHSWLYIVLFILGIIYFLLHWFTMKYRWILLAGSHLLLFFYVLFIKDNIIQDIYTILYSTQVPVDIPYFILVVSILIVLWIFTFLFILYQPVFLFILICLLLSFLTITGTGISFFVLFSIFVFTFFLLARKYPSRKNIISLLIVCIVSLPIGLCVSHFVQQPLSNEANRLEQLIHETFQDTSNQDRILSSGMVSLGNNYASDDIVFSAQMETKPDSNIYLKNFTGFLYEENQWTPNESLMQIEEVSNEYSDSLEPYQYRNYQARIQNTLTKQLNMEPQTIKILPKLRETQITSLSPYNTAMKWNYDQRTTFSFYPALNHIQDLDSLYLDDELIEFIQYDQKAAQTLYQSVDRAALPKLAKLVDDNPKTNQDEITAFIVKLLENYTQYTRTPGHMSSQEDVVESFLFTNQKGYCVHYASTAALLYRLYGIPSRYVTGYVIYPDDFSYEQGQYTADVSEKNSHAWVELYFPRYGWIPIDMTPDANQKIHVEYPGLNEEKLQQLIKEDTSDFSSLNSHRINNNGLSWFSFSLKDVVLVCIGSIIIIFIVLLIHYFYKKQRKEKCSISEYMDHILHLFYMYPELREIDLLDEKNIEVIHQIIPGLTTDFIQNLQQKAQIIYYSPYTLKKSDLKRLKKQCLYAILPHLSLWQRFFYHYIYCLY